jgi:hypothetical protein
MQMPKIYLEIEIELSGNVISGMAATRNDPGHADYIEDIDVEDVTFEVGGKTYDLLKGLSPEAIKQVRLNLTDSLIDQMAEAIFEDA